VHCRNRVDPTRRHALGLQHGRGLTGAPDAPTVEEVGGWIESFATRRGGRSTDWIRAAWAAAAWSLAYNARCDELLGADADDSHPQACRQDADQYLANIGR
jgi:hypothetical protein